MFVVLLEPGWHEQQIPMPQTQIGVAGGAAQAETARHTEGQDRLRAPVPVVMPPAACPVEISLETARREHTPRGVLEPVEQPWAGLRENSRPHGDGFTVGQVQPPR